MSKEKKSIEAEAVEVSPAVAALEGIEQDLQTQAEEIASAVDQETGSAQEAEAVRLAGEAAAKAAATMGVNMLTSVALMRVPYLVITPEANAAVIDKLGPVLLKHGVGAEMPPWLAAYREEIELGMVLAGIGFGIYLQVDQHRKAEVIQMEEERQRQRQSQNNQNGRVDLSTGQQAAA